MVLCGVCTQLQSFSMTPAGFQLNFLTATQRIEKKRLSRYVVFSFFFRKTNDRSCHSQAENQSNVLIKYAEAGHMRFTWSFMEPINCAPNARGEKF